MQVTAFLNLPVDVPKRLKVGFHLYFDAACARYHTARAVATNYDIHDPLTRCHDAGDAAAA